MIFVFLFISPVFLLTYNEKCLNLFEVLYLRLTYHFFLCEYPLGHASHDLFPNAVWHHKLVILILCTNPKGFVYGVHFLFVACSLSLVALYFLLLFLLFKFLIDHTFELTVEFVSHVQLCLVNGLVRLLVEKFHLNICLAIRLLQAFSLHFHCDDFTLIFFKIVLILLVSRIH